MKFPSRPIRRCSSPSLYLTYPDDSAASVSRAAPGVSRSESVKSNCLRDGSRSCDGFPLNQVSDRRGGNQKWIGRGSGPVPRRRTDAVSRVGTRGLDVEAVAPTHTHLPHTHTSIYLSSIWRRTRLVSGPFDNLRNRYYHPRRLIGRRCIAAPADNSPSGAVRALLIATPTVAATGELVSGPLLLSLPFPRMALTAPKQHLRYHTKGKPSIGLISNTLQPFAHKQVVLPL